MCLESKRLFIHPCIATKKFLQGRHNLLNPQYSLGVAQMAFYMSGIQTPEPPHEPDSGLYQKFPDSSNISKIKKMSGYFNMAQTFQTVSKLYGSFWMTSNLPDGFQNIQIFPGILKTFQTVSKLLGSFQRDSKLFRSFKLVSKLLLPYFGTPWIYDYWQYLRSWNQQLIQYNIHFHIHIQYP